MTSAAKSLMGVGMSRWGLSLLLMLLSSFLATSALHAAEMSGPVTMECSGYVHDEGDNDQSQGDADKGVPHHHASCHGGASFLPSRDQNPLLQSVLKQGVPATRSHALGRWIAGPDLRPPIA
ncbi:hypothetical protein [Novosphingobium sp. YAF33]|uniref:hypothetical protein n=1 Tax=Novosphingobium sp. YAF33 TaxID=3233082 RepID=UPI003F99412B